jgi:hypothetical protein
VLHLPGIDIWFKKRDKLHEAAWYEEQEHSTVKKNEAPLPRQKLAKELSTHFQRRQYI